MAKDRIQPLKLEDPSTGGVETDGFPTSCDPHEDFVDCRGVAIQNDISNDDAVLVSRDSGSNLTFTDSVTGLKTLAELAAGGGMSPGDHRVLDQLVHNLAESCYEEYAYAGGRVTGVITWETSGKLKKIREEQFTYSSGKVSTATTIQYDTGGSEFERLVETYAYSGSNVTSVTAVRSTP